MDVLLAVTTMLLVSAAVLVWPESPSLAVPTAANSARGHLLNGLREFASHRR